MPKQSFFGTGVDWDFDTLSGLITNRGEELIHEIGMRCVCNLEDTFAGQIEQTHVPRKRNIFGCDICTGDGYIFRNPKKIIALITSINERKDWLAEGWAIPGDCTMSVQPDYAISGHDQVTFTRPQSIPDGQVIIRGAGTMSDNSARDTKVVTDEDRLWYCATDAIWCEDEDGIVYSNSDFSLNSSKVIKWFGNQPAIGKKYTIKYNAYLEWIAFNPPNERRDRNRDLGARVPLRKKHAVFVNRDPRIRAEDKVPFCSRIQSC